MTCILEYFQIRRRTKIDLCIEELCGIFLLCVGEAPPIVSTTSFMLMALWNRVVDLFPKGASSQQNTPAAQYVLACTIYTGMFNMYWSIKSFLYKECVFTKDKAPSKISTINCSCTSVHRKKNYLNWKMMDNE